MVPMHSNAFSNEVFTLHSMSLYSNELCCVTLFLISLKNKDCFAEFIFCEIKDKACLGFFIEGFTL